MSQKKPNTSIGILLPGCDPRGALRGLRQRHARGREHVRQLFPEIGRGKGELYGSPWLSLLLR